MSGATSGRRDATPAAVVAALAAVAFAAGCATARPEAALDTKGSGESEKDCSPH